MKRDGLFLLSVFCSFLFPAVAQEPVYTVTETELTELESISQSLAISRQNLQSQASDLAERLRAQENKAKSLTEKLQQAENTANDLRNQLQTEQATLKNLRVSYSAYEKEAAQKMAEMQTVIDKQRRKIHRLTVTVVTLLTVLVGFIVFAMIKLKRFFPFLP
ncbi:hypothetical protein E4N71_07510 [Treponema vincentii]|uniref:hypothetical protein n=1 Tax=Treponema vincentii TaxID=69710 RepID=UPI003D8C9411